MTLSRASGPTLSKAVVQRLCLGLAVLGLDAGAALSRAGLSAAKLAELPDRIPQRTLWDFWTAVVETTGRCGVGVRLGELARPESYEVLGYVIRSSATLRDALVRTGRYMRLANDAVDLSFHLEGERGLLLYRNAFAELSHPEGVECLFSALVTLSRHMTQTRYGPLEVRFDHDAPDDCTEHERVFGAPVRFGCPHSGLVFESAILSLPIVTHDSKLCEILEQQAEQLLKSLPSGGTYTRRVQQVLAAELRGGNPFAENVAAQLGIHRKTLSRRLKEEGTSHRELLDSVRRELAERYLIASDAAIGEIAFLLGFSDASAFNKAFRRWTGMAPLAYRQRAQIGGAGSG